VLVLSGVVTVDDSHVVFKLAPLVEGGGQVVTVLFENVGVVVEDDEELPLLSVEGIAVVLLYDGVAVDDHDCGGAVLLLENEEEAVLLTSVAVEVKVDSIVELAVPLLSGWDVVVLLAVGPEEVKVDEIEIVDGAVPVTPLVVKYVEVLLVQCGDVKVDELAAVPPLGHGDVVVLLP
jgi:hypothetical protein